MTYTGSIEVSMPDLTSYNLCNAWEKLEAERIEGVYTSANPQTQVDLTKRYNALKAQVLGGLDTYWLAKPLRTASATNTPSRSNWATAANCGR